MRFKIFLILCFNFLVTYRGISDSIQITKDTISAFIFNESRKFTFGGHNDVGLCTDSYLWLGLFDKGLLRINGDNSKFFLKGYGGRSSFNTLCIYEDFKGEMWVGDIEGFQRFDKEREIFTSCAITSFLGKEKYAVGVKKILRIDNEKFVLGTKAGVHIYDIKKDTISNFLITGDYDVDGQSTSKSVYSFVLDKDQKCVWFTTRSGLGKMMLDDYSIQFIEDPYDEKRGQVRMMTEMVLMNKKLYIKYDNSKIIKYDISNNTWENVYERKFNAFLNYVDQNVSISAWLKNFQKLDDRYFLTCTREFGPVLIDTKLDQPQSIWIKNPKFSVVDKFENPSILEHRYLTDCYWAFVDKNGFLIASFGREMIAKTVKPILVTDKDIDYGDIKIEHLYIHGEEKEIGKYLIDYEVLSFNSFERDLSFTFRLVSPNKDNPVQYRYAIDNSNQWNYTLDNDVATFNQLSGGEYSIRLQALQDKKIIAERNINLKIKKLWHEEWVNRLLIVFLFITPFFILYRYRQKKIRETNLLKNQLAEVEMTVLRAQMNPHFMFNSLNSINQYIVTENPRIASDYLTKFSRLMRQILNNSKQKLVLLKDELDALDLYIQMEQLRFDQSFDYTIVIDDKINLDSIVVPPLIIQPYVENAIRHGVALLNDEKGRVEVHVGGNADEIEISIDDNGIGRKKAGEINDNKRIKKESHGMSITADRIELISKIYKVEADVEIIDKYSEDQKPKGTRVLIIIPKIKANSY